MRVSTNFAIALIALLGAASAVRLAALGGAHGDDPCASPDALRATSLIPGSVALGERLEALDGAVFQWSEGEIANPLLPKLPMQFQIIRSWDAPRLYNNPIRHGDPAQREAGAGERRRPPRLQPEELRVRELDVDGVRVPIHLAWDHTDTGTSRLVAWLFVFDDRPVRSPLAAQLRGALGLAFEGPRPLTLVTLAAVAPAPSTARVEDAAADWFADAWRYVARACQAP
jgi:hypothetical protein